MKKKIFKIIEKIDEMGGTLEAIGSNWMKHEIINSALMFHSGLETHDIIQVGVNKYTEADEIEVKVPRTSPYKAERRDDAEARQIENLWKIRQQRDNQRVRDCLIKIENAAREERENLIPFFVEAVKEYVTLGEICKVLRNVFGEAK